jgi:ribosomal protein L29
MRFKDLSNLKPTELEKKQKEAAYELIKLQAQVATGTTPKSPGQLRQLRRLLAKIHTLKTQRNNQKEDHTKDA